MSVMTISCRHFGFIITPCSAASLMHHEYLQNPLPSPFLISWKVRMLIVSVQVYFCRFASKILLLIQEHHLSVINILPSWRWEINIYLISQISSSNWILKHLVKHQSFLKILYYAYNISIYVLNIMIFHFLSFLFSFSLLSLCLCLRLCLSLHWCWPVGSNFISTSWILFDFYMFFFSFLFFLNKQVW